MEDKQIWRTQIDEEVSLPGHLEKGARVLFSYWAMSVSTNKNINPLTLCNHAYAVAYVY